MPRFSANLGFLWPDLPMIERIDAAARAGFGAIEMHWPDDIPARLLRAQAEARGLAILAINTPMGGEPGDFGLGAVPGREAEFRAGFAACLACARELGACAIHVMAGVPGEAQGEISRATFLANLRHALPLAAQAGLTLLLEPINRQDRPGYFYDRLEEAQAIIDEIGHPTLKIMFDCYHVGTTEAGGSAARIEALLARHFGSVGHIQFASVPGRAEPDEGRLDYRALFRAIDRLGHKGWVGAEYRPRGATDAGLGWMRALA